MLCVFFFFFFNDTATTEIYTLSLHDALPILHCLDDSLFNRGDKVPGNGPANDLIHELKPGSALERFEFQPRDRKSTRLNSSHGYISYAVFCLKKKKKIATTTHTISRKVRLYR